MKLMDFIRVHQIFFESRANGPGLRTVIFFQGCSLNCPDCINPATHDPSGGKQLDINSIFEEIDKRQEIIEGITCSGGEPFQQPEGLLAIVIGAKHRDLGIIISTGYEKKELSRKVPLSSHILKNTDLLIAGRFHKNERIYEGLRGSSNKCYSFLTNRYSYAQLSKTHRMEIQIKGNEIIASGIEVKNFFPWSGFTNESKN